MASPDRTVILNSLFVGATVIVAISVIIWMFRDDTPDQDQPTPTPDASSDEATIAFEAFDYDVARLQDEWREERHEFGELAIGGDEEALIEEFYRVNDRSTATESQEELLALNNALQDAVTRYITAHGPRAYRAVGWHLVDEFHRALRDTFITADRVGSAPWTVLEGGAPTALPFRQRLGNFFVMARERGLVDEDGNVVVDPTLLTALFRYRWLGFARDYANMYLMTPYERVVIWRWRIEAATDVPSSVRLAMVDEAEAIYRTQIDPDAVRGIILYEAGNLNEALRFFRRAHRTDPDDERYEQYIEIVEAQLQ